jgi:hypothetical protein
LAGFLTEGFDRRWAEVEGSETNTSKINGRIIVRKRRAGDINFMFYLDYLDLVILGFEESLNSFQTVSNCDQKGVSKRICVNANEEYNIARHGLQE